MQGMALFAESCPWPPKRVSDRLTLDSNTCMACRALAVTVIATMLCAKVEIKCKVIASGGREKHAGHDGGCCLYLL